ncbi:MAG: carbohydrate binding family 9 domain-containing protein [Chitinophagaceae bacterium]|nr:carbohydrate binding family 9 domain-containing protein [Chitinophagaceae bacterium]
MRFKVFFCLPFLLFCGTIFSQTKTVLAVKIAQAPKIDGNLNDEAWVNITPATDFIQNYPSAGTAASQQTKVKVVYDDEAIYIGANLYDNPDLIRKQLTARDAELQKDVDFFSIFLDTYNDKQNGFHFVVTSANVQSDARLGPNLGNGGSGFGDYGDKSWDAVWESKVQIQSDGWSVEMKIPYISLRFAKMELQNWGIQFQRQIRRTNENCFWNTVDPNVNGFVNQFGQFVGLKNLQPPLRLSFAPYVSTGYRSSPEVNGYSNTWLRSGGMDVKYGINESFTLDATLIPDFGQVISDNVINNLSPFEVQFQDNRQFFSEGTEIFKKAGLFYSRRVGDIPSKYNSVRNFVGSNTDWEIKKNPSATQLYNATKFSGRTDGKLGIGIFNAITAPMEARLHNTISGKDSTIQTEPLANYNIVVLDQALKGRSFLTLTNTNVIRNGDARDANVTAFDFSLYDKKNLFNVKGTARYSKIFGNNPYDGYNSTLRMGKVSGKWQYYLLGNVESAKYDPRDLGFLQAPNEVSLTKSITYSQFTPTKNLLSYNYRITAKYTKLYAPSAFSDFQVNANGFWLLKNFWDISLNARYITDQHDYFVLGDPSTYKRFVKRPRYGSLTLSGSTDSRKRLYISYSALFADFFNSAPNKYYHILTGGIRYRFSNKFTLDLSHTHETETDYIIAAGREINNEPRIAFVDFTDVTTVLSGIYNFTSRFNLTLRARHYLSRLNFNRFANVDNKGNPIPRTGTTSFDNVNIFNLDAFLTWDFRLGSRLIVGYKNWLGDNEVVSLTGKNNYLRNLGEIFDLRHGNELTVRFIYFIDYNKLRKKKAN